ncbi:hypothetical protein AAMO2058_000752700 [Amorphochlora amoebiformis]
MYSSDAKESLEEGEIPQKVEAISLGHGRLQAGWGYGNSVIFAESKRLGGNLAPVKFHIYEWGRYEKNLRTLLMRWHGIYTRLQRGISARKKDILLKSSIQYRSEFLAMGNALADEKAVSFSRSQEDDKEAEGRRRILEVAYVIWYLCEIFWIDPNANVTAQMITWIQWGSPIGDEDTPECIRRLVLQGRTQDAIDKLSSIERLRMDNHLELDQVLDLLRNVPSVKTQKLSPNDFLDDFRLWKDEVRKAKRATRNQDLRDILQILDGDERTLVEYSESGLELLVSKLIYQRPEMTKEEIPYLAEECMGRFESFKLEECLLAIINGDLYTAMQICVQLIDQPWFLAHLVDLLHTAGHLRDKIPGMEQSYREFCVIEYASGLMTRSSLWHLSLIYFHHSGSIGKAHIRTLVSTVPITSVRVARRLLAVCETYQLTILKRSIYNRMGARAIRRGRLGEAIQWYSYSEANGIVLSLTKKVLKELLSRNDDVYADVECIGIDASTPENKSRQVWSCLALIDKVRSFCKLRGEVERMGKSGLRGVTLAEKQKKLIKIAVQIFTSKLGDYSLWLQLLYECARMIELGKVHNSRIMSAGDSLLLMGVLEKATIFARKAHRKGGVGEDPKKIQAVRMALARGMSRAMISQNLK